MTNTPRLMSDKVLSIPLSSRLWLVVICLLCSMIYMIRLSGPTDLESYAQVLNIGYILDLMTRGNWLVQYDIENAIMSKPPIHTWLMAPFAALFGLNRLALTLPSFLSVLALALLLFNVGKKRFGELAGGLAAMAIVLAPATAKQVTLVRTDPVFTLTVAIAALVAFAAWKNEKEGAKSWYWFWLMAAITTLIKGPLGIVLAAGGLLSYFWEKRSALDLPSLRGPHFGGLALFLLLTLGWFTAAWLSEGQALIDKMFYTELIGHAVGEHRGGWQATDLLKPTFFLLVRYLPFSIPFLVAFWRVFRQPAVDPVERRFERFLVCWVLVGLLIFSVVKHQRADHLLPLWPACALLAGRELARWAERMGKTKFAGMAIVISCILVGATYAAVHPVVGTRNGSTDYARELKLASDTEQAAKAFISSGIEAKQLHHIDTPLTLQLYLGTYRPYLTLTQLDKILADANGPIDLALGKSSIADSGIREKFPGTKQIFRWPEDESLKPVFQVYRVLR